MPSLFQNVEAINQRVTQRAEKRKNFINQLLNNEQDDDEFRALIAAKQAMSPTPAPVDLASEAAGPAPAPLQQAVAQRVGGHEGHSHDAKGVDPNFNTALNRLVAKFGGKVSVSNAYRSPERQAQLWQAALKKYGSAAKARKWVAPPGRSNHQRGLAADLKFHGIDPKVVHAAAREFGLHFPLSNENWHIEPISARKK